jgi:hypothetical protein
MISRSKQLNLLECVFEITLIFHDYSINKNNIKCL